IGGRINNKKPMNNRPRMVKRRVEAIIEIITRSKQLQAWRKVAQRLAHQRQYAAIHFQPH
ncbi:MAG: hypothetical protein WBN88_16445, partial [Anderseniella sp.]